MLVVLIACCLSACEHVFAGETVAAETVTEIQFDPSWDFSEITVPVGDGYQQSACCPDWCQYGIVDFLFLQRDNATNGAVITEESVGGQPPVPLFTTRSMQAATAPGVRLFYGELGPDCMGWEVGYLGVYGMFGAVDRSAVDALSIPGDIGNQTQGWLSADEVRPTYSSSLNTVEANIFMYQCCPECSSDSLLWSHLGNKPVCHCRNWLFGFRWAGLEEQADLNVLCCSNNPTDVFTSYSVRTSSQMLGPQVGFRGRRQWKNWAVEGWAKAMLAGTLLSSNADPIFSSLAPTTIIRPARRLTDAGVGFLGDLNYTVSRRLSDMWWLRLGYNMIWLSGVALAPNQWDFTDTATSGTTLVGGGGVFLHGANLGLEARW